MPLRAGARGRSAARHTRRDGANRRRRRPAHAPRPRRLRRDALRGALRSNPRGGTRPAARGGAGARQRVRAASGEDASGRDGARPGAPRGAVARALAGVAGGAVNHRGLVVGAGVAGTAAALAAARAGAPVTLVDGGTGASTLATGALDALFWQRAPASPAAIDRAAREALDALGGYVLPDEGARLLTTSGIARPARGHDAALLDVAPLGGARVGVVRCERPGWDAGALARAWGESFEPIDAVVMRYADERDIPDADFATRHDDDARLGWLAERLRDALARSGH